MDLVASMLEAGIRVSAPSQILQGWQFFCFVTTVCPASLSCDLGDVLRSLFTITTCFLDNANRLGVNV